MVKKTRGKNEGSIWRHGGRWRAAVTLGGKRVTKLFSSKVDCRNWIRDMQNQIEQGLTYSATRLSLEQFLTEWLKIHNTGLKPRTIERYTQIVRDYIVPYIGNIKLQDLRLDLVEKLYRDLLNESVSIRNVQLTHAVLHRSLKDAVRRGLVGLNAAHGARQPKKPYKEMQIFDENQVMHFLLCAMEDRHEAIYHLAIKTGMRQGELLGLKWSDLDWNRGTLKIQRQVQRVPGHGRTFVSPKTRAGRRTISLGRETLNILRMQKERQFMQKETTGDRWQEFDLIFPSKVGTPLSASNFLKEFKSLLEKAGLPRIRFHDLRHTAASLMLNHGIPPFIVSKILGHSKPSTTMDIYGHLIPTDYGEVGNLMDDWITPVPIDMGEKVNKNKPGTAKKT